MRSFGWNLTITGAVLCLLYGWFLCFVARTQGVKSSKAGLLVGVVGTVVLAAMAVVSPPRILDSKIVEMVEVYNETRKEIGPRPSRDHVAYKNTTGELVWVTVLEYNSLFRESVKNQRKGRNYGR